MGNDANLQSVIAAIDGTRNGSSVIRSHAPAEPIQARILRETLPLVRRVNPFKEGDLVQQLPVYGNYKWPAGGGLAIVSQIKKAHGSQYRDEAFTGKMGPIQREDMVILCVVGDQWLEFAVESWRFKAYDGPLDADPSSVI